MASSRILIVDDEPAVAAFIGTVARRCGYEVRLTSSASEFEAAYRAFAPDVVVLDISMPDKDGVELLYFLIETGCTATVLIASGYHDWMVEGVWRVGEARGLKMGPFLRKPLRSDELKSIFETLRPGLAGTN